MNDDLLNSKRWCFQIKNGITSADQLKVTFEKRNIRKTSKFYNNIEKVSKTFPMRISPHLIKLCLKSKAIYKQFIPNLKELSLFKGSETDPLGENEKMPVENLIHIYPDRALLLVTNMCFGFCRFCTRKRLKREYLKINTENLEKACKYITKRKEIKDVIISGGDPLILNDSELEEILKKIKNIKNVRIIRIGTRAPLACPDRITDDLIKMLKKFYPLYINIHFNHPDEFTSKSINILKKMSKAGIILGNQSVLLKGINDSSEIMKELFYKCLDCGVKPYYLYQCDKVLGTELFWTDYQKIFYIARNISGKISGLAVPHFVFDYKKRVGKIRIVPDLLVRKNKNSITFKNFLGKSYTYKNLIRKNK